MKTEENKNPESPVAYEPPCLEVVSLRGDEVLAGSCKDMAGGSTGPEVACKDNAGINPCSTFGS